MVCVVIIYRWVANFWLSQFAVLQDFSGKYCSVCAGSVVYDLVFCVVWVYYHSPAIFYCVYGNKYLYGFLFEGKQAEEQEI